MPRNNSKFSWSILMLLQLSIVLASPPNIAYPDSYEMYSYKEPRSMNDLKQQHVRQAMIDVTDTINEVQKILQKDPRLPRLTRGEIEDLFEMVTREEYKRSLAIGDFERAKHMRSLMLVLPFNTNNYSEERLEELFTQTPVTKMIDVTKNLKNPKPQRIVVPASAENSVLDMIGAHSDVTNHKMPTTFKPNFPINRMKTTYTAPVTTFHPKATVQTVSAYNPRLTAQTVANMHPRMTMQTMPSLYPKPAPAQTFATFHPKSTMQTMANMYPKSTVQTVSGYRPKATLQTAASFNQPKTTLEPPISSYHPKATLQTISANAIPTDFVSTYHPKTATFKVTQESNVGSTQLNPKYSSRFSAQTTYFTPTVTPTMRPNVKNMLASIGLEPDDTPTISSESQQPSTIAGPTTVRTTTIAATTTTTTTTPKPELTPELKELLESFGLLTNEEPPAHVTAGAYQDEFHPIFPSSLKDESLSVSEFKPLPKSVTASDIEGKIEESSLEIKPDDFSSFKPLPLPEEKAAKDEDLEKLLKTYGLLEEEERGSKEIDDVIEKLNNDSEESGSETFEVTAKPYNKISEVPEVDVGFLSPELAKVLGNIGVKSVNQQATSATPVITRRIDTTEPVEHSTGQGISSTMKEDYQKLHLLLDTIKQLDNLNANLTEEELDKLNLKNFNLSKDTLLESEGPDPTYDVQSATKNEVKRQTNASEPTRIQLDITGTTQSSGSSSTTSDDDDADDITKSDDQDTAKLENVAMDDEKTSETPREGKNEDLKKEKDTETESSSPSSTTSTTTTTEESKNGDLAGSFGGNDGLDQPVSEEPLPPPRKNGFYFFSDWNSFLEVGEDPDKVVVRFDPKIGDPSQFVKVKDV
ncbi:mucin-2 isoform X2 [Sitodiplosis mosellana]|nr:mucin-2 isoform X2 [Sitodiplosis mosellana]XP_055310892.1 mucin-2 isoform X2 [Sitodiplosis mosellana]XP_055310899.1 mucin-2 isoform X2 [Sitodiplosis mosellana]XP_055310908.1 mucin-2 isoform X2 [Sitodiplosis mosellana]XP_055310915.1 mucin-2 isoform X2 [Sitodiplosis mosellana]XP_055310923.1 mucin-2 isoform X2 [Sitodiplosis mosellana]